MFLQMPSTKETFKGSCWIRHFYQYLAAVKNNLMMTSTQVVSIIFTGKPRNGFTTLFIEQQVNFLFFWTQVLLCQLHQVILQSPVEPFWMSDCEIGKLQISHRVRSDGGSHRRLRPIGKWGVDQHQEGGGITLNFAASTFFVLDPLFLLDLEPLLICR